MRALVTGANGCLGSHIVRTLVKSGVDVRALVRENSDLSALNGLPVERVVGELRDADSLLRACQGVEQVYHTAALTSTDGIDRQSLFDVNVKGTERLLDAARKAQVKRFIYTSSAAVLGFTDDPADTLDEGVPFTLDANRFPYQTSKFQAEERVRAAARAGLSSVICMPGLLFGAWDRAQHSTGLIRMARKGGLLFYPPGGIAAVTASDAAEGHILAARSGQSGARYLLSGENLPFKDLFRIIRRFAGGPGTWFPVPDQAVASASVLSQQLSRITRKPSPLNASRVKALCSFGYVSDHLARTTLHYEPGLVEVGVKAACDWLDETHGW